MRKKIGPIEWEKRLRAVKLRFVFNTKCRCCGDFISREKMYVVPQWANNKKINRWYYCQECMHSKEDVLKEIYKKGNFRGIPYIDEYTTVPHPVPAAIRHYLE